MKIGKRRPSRPVCDALYADVAVLYSNRLYWQIHLTAYNTLYVRYAMGVCDVLAAALGYVET